MSDENALISSLNKRISELESSKANLEVALRGSRKDAKRLKTELDDFLSKADGEFSAADEEKAELLARIEEYEARASAAPDEKDARIKELEGSIRTRDHKDVWAKAVGSELHEKASIEKLWGEIGYAPESDAPDAAQITEWVGKAREAAPYLFVPPAVPGNGTTSQGVKPALKVAESPGRGARDHASAGVRISRKEMSEPGWMSRDKAKAEAFKSGDYTLVDD